MTAYYSENDPYCVAWLRNLIDAGLIAPGVVDDRDIRDVTPDDVAGFTQVHTFAGLGGWSYAARLAGWPDDRPLWTGSCPCQPFSVAGKRKGFTDERDLWPVWLGLIAQCRPTSIVGEQIARAPAWQSRARGDLEALGYAVGCMPIEAASCGAADERDRFWFVADGDGERPQEPIGESGDAGAERSAASRGDLRTLPDRDHAERRADSAAWDDAVRQAAGWEQGPGDVAERDFDPMEHFASVGWGEGWTEHELRGWGFTAAVASSGGLQYFECPDGKWRRLPPPRVRWLGTKIPARVAKLRAFGNAIDPYVAAEILRAYMESTT